MRTNPDDLAADVAELDQRFAQQRERVHQLKDELRKAENLYEKLYQFRRELNGIAELHQLLSHIDDMDAVSCPADEPSNHCDGCGRSILDCACGN